MINGLKTFGVVALVTMLVWVVAESASVRSESISTSIVPGSTDDLAVEFAAPLGFDGTVAVTVDGATGRLDAATRALRTALRLEPGMPGVPRDAGEHPLDLRRVLQQSPALSESGVRVVSVEPPSITLRVEPMISRSLPVRVVVPDLELEGPPEPMPPAVLVRLPSSMAEKLPADATVTAAVEGPALAGLRAGQRRTLPNIPVQLPEMLASQRGLDVSPSRVEVTLALRNQVVSKPVAEAPVHVWVDPAWLVLWDLQIAPDDRVLNDILVTGPPNLVAEVVNPPGGRPAQVAAFIAPTLEELEQAGSTGRPLELQARFTSMPSSLVFEVKDRTIVLSVKPRDRLPAGPWLPDAK
jgi:hypothetical protein